MPHRFVLCIVYRVSHCIALHWITSILEIFENRRWLTLHSSYVNKKMETETLSMLYRFKRLSYAASAYRVHYVQSLQFYIFLFILKFIKVKTILCMVHTANIASHYYNDVHIEHQTIWSYAKAQRKENVRRPFRSCLDFHFKLPVWLWVNFHWFPAR